LKLIVNLTYKKKKLTMTITYIKCTLSNAHKAAKMDYKGLKFTN